MFNCYENIRRFEKTTTISWANFKIYCNKILIEKIFYLTMVMFKKMSVK